MKQNIIALQSKMVEIWHWQPSRQRCKYHALMCVFEQKKGCATT